MPPFEIRQLSERDEPAVLALLDAAFAGAWPGAGETRLAPADVLRWKHRDGYFGPSLAFVAEADGELVGFEGWLPWRFRAGGRVLEALYATDLAVRADWRGRGVADALRKTAETHYPPSTAIVVANLNQRSSAVARRAGRGSVPIPIAARVPRPLRTSVALATRRSHASAARAGAPAAATVLTDEERLKWLLTFCSDGAGRLMTARDPAFLRWRYALEPYRALVAGDGGVAIFRLLPRRNVTVARVCELLVPDAHPRSATALLGRVAAATSAQVLTCAFSSSLEALRHHFVPAGRHVSLMVAPLRADVAPDPRRRDSWALSEGGWDLL